MVLTLTFLMQLQPDGSQDWTSKMVTRMSGAVDRNTSCGISSMAAPGELDFLHGSWIPPERVSQENQMAVIWPFLT